ncbi:MAG: hypothetical protein KKD44_03605 [Proteobacteria bacterium]|nr:hypothetical protein [Pseudomonadota bacterium]
MPASLKSVLFDPQDYELLNIVNDVLEGGKERRHLKNIIGSNLHPHGIVEMAAPKALRMAYSIVHLIGSLDADEAKDRIMALQTLNYEVMNSKASTFRFNTARVLLQIMKELIRHTGDKEEALKLAHDFRAAATGNQRVVRKQLRKFHLLEMPEDWNQLSFDDHVHDANTKGRKSPTHLIMDAWIKGIRFLTVIYYNYIEPEAASELMEAAQIMGISVRIGVEFPARFRGRYINLIWGVRGLSQPHNYLSFLSKPHVLEFMNESRNVSVYQQQYVFKILSEFNNRHIHSIRKEFSILMEPICTDGFLRSVGTGQPSLLHLAKHIHTCMIPAMRRRLEEIRKDYAKDPNPEKDAYFNEVIRAMNHIDPDMVYDAYLSPTANPSVIDPRDSLESGPHVPPMLMRSPIELIDDLKRIRHGSRITLNLTHLTPEDVLEVLYDCGGNITHLEIFNLKDSIAGKAPDYEAINGLQMALNSGNAVRLKRIILDIIDTLKKKGQTQRAQRINEILLDISTFMDFYKDIPLKSCIGTDSTGHSRKYPGMGIAIARTLPRAARRALRKNQLQYLPIPLKVKTCFRVTGCPGSMINPFIKWLNNLIRFLPFAVFFGQKRIKDWVIQPESVHFDPKGNIITIGGIADSKDNGLHLVPRALRKKKGGISFAYMNSGLKNGLKILCGFIPAFLTFALTKDWWVLAYLGAFIWFGITGFRNILQSVLGGGGFRRSPLVRWKDYVSWQRFSDSLFYTGFSVPLLDYLVKTLVLDRGFGVTTSTSPQTLYAVMALVNGVYLSSHNMLRGLPKGAVFGNFFRSILSIPVAIFFNTLVGGSLYFLGIPNVNDILQKWAAVISKAASDSMAGVIEGIADRFENIRLRQIDYDKKLSQIRDAYIRLEILFPETDVETFFKAHDQFEDMNKTKPVEGIDQILILNALDLLYFWMYQPRARDVFRAMIRAMSDEERRVLVRSHLLLTYQKKISLMFVDGIIGKQFSRGLSFYLSRSEGYLREVERMAGKA